MNYYGVFLPMGAGKVYSRAVVAFRQSVLTAEMVSAIRTTKRKKRFLPTLSAFHALPTHILW